MLKEWKWQVFSIGTVAAYSAKYSVFIIIIIIIIIKNEKIRVTLCENAAGALYIVNNGATKMSRAHSDNRR